MVHVKYTYKNGKKFGPYYYENKRVNGKVVTKYLGNVHPSEKKKEKKIPILKIFFGLLLVLLLIIFIWNYQGGITGKANLELRENVKEGEMLDGKLKFNVREGELIPADSIVKVSVGEQTKEISLRELLGDSGLISGEFKAEDTSISGYGEGYGLSSKKEVYPEVSFKLKVYQMKEVISGGSGGSGTEEGSDNVVEGEDNQEVTEGNIDDGVEDNIDSESSIDGVGSSEDSGSGDVINDNVGSGEGSSGTDTTSSTTSSESTGSGTSDTSSSSESTGSSGESSSESASSTGSESSSSSSSSETSSSAITGSVIAEEEYEISGSVKKGEVFEYNLEEGQRAEIVSGSVMVDGEAVDDSIIKLKIAGGKAEVTTDYFVLEEASTEVIGEKTKSIEIDLSRFDLNVSGESVKVELTYNSEVLASAEKKIVKSADEIVEEIKDKGEGKGDIISGNKTIDNVTIVNDSIIDINVSDVVNGSSDINITIDTNITEVNIILNASEIVKEVNITQFAARLGEPVKWKKSLDVSGPAQVIVELPLSAENVAIKKINDIGEEEEIEGIGETSADEDNVKVDLEGNVLTGRVSADIELDEDGNKIIGFFRKIFRLTGRAVDENEETQEIVVDIVESDKVVEVEYETPAAYSLEEEIDNGKRVKVFGPDDVHYENIIAFTTLDEGLNIVDGRRVKIFWREEGTYLSPLNVSDSDGNGIYDYVEWIVPRLSNQTFDIILITRAEHLDENRDFVSDIYDAVKERDYNYSEEIPMGHYVRVGFEKNLTKEKDITVYAKSSDNGMGIDVYEKDGSEVIASFDSITTDDKYRVILEGLNDREQDTFDLKVKGDSAGGIEFDYIVDPTDTAECSFLNIANTIYNLTQNVAANGTCFDVVANNITLEGNNFTITYAVANNQSNYNGIRIAGANDTKIRNVRITVTNSSGSDKDNDAIYIISANSTIIQNAYIYNLTMSSADGIYIENSNNLTIINANVSVVDSTCLTFTNVNNMNVTNSRFSSSGNGYPIYHLGTTNAIFNNITIENSYYGVVFGGDVGHTLFINSYINATEDLRLHNTLATGVSNFTNVSFGGKEDFVFIGTPNNVAKFDIYLPVTIQVNDTYGYAIYQANVTAYEKGSNVSIVPGAGLEYPVKLTNTNGLTTNLFLRERRVNASAGNLLLTNHTINASKMYYTQSNITNNITRDKFRLITLNQHPDLVFFEDCNDMNSSEWTISPPDEWVVGSGECVSSNSVTPASATSMTFNLQGKTSAKLEYLYDLTTTGGVGYNLSVFISNNGGTSYVLAANHTGTKTGRDSILIENYVPLTDSIKVKFDCTPGLGLWCKIDEVAVFNVTGYNLTSCATLDVANKTYYLMNNVSSSETCITINANNITLDCQNNIINHSVSTGSASYGININRANSTTIKNCDIIDGNYSDNLGNGIYVRGNASKIINNKIIGNDTCIETYTYYSINLSNNNISFDTKEIPAVNIDVIEGYIYNNSINTINPTIAFALSSTNSYNNIFTKNIISTKGKNSTGLSINGIINLSDVNITTKGANANAIRLSGIGNQIDIKDSYINAENDSCGDDYCVADIAAEINQIYPSAITGYINITNVTGVTNISCNDFGYDIMNAHLLVSWYADVYTNYTNGTDASNSNVTIRDLYNNVVSSTKTGSDGRINKLSLNEYRLYCNSTYGISKSFFTNHTFNVTNPSANNAFLQSWNMSTNMFLNFMFTLLNPAPKITINNPRNNTNVTSEYPLLNWTIQDDENSSEVWVWASNTTGNLYDRLVYHKKKEVNGSNWYNLTGLPVISNDFGLVLSAHLDNLTSKLENDSVAYDSISQTYGNVLGASVWNDSARFAGGFEFDSTNDRINFTDPKVGNVTPTSMTVAAWVKIRAAGTKRIVSRYGATVSYELSLSTTPGQRFFFRLNGAAASRVESNATYPIDNRWTHVVATYDGAKTCMYINGEANNCTAYSTAIGYTERGLYIGGDGAGNYFNGTIDEVAIWNRTLNGAEILELYNLSLGRYYWRVNATDGTTMNSSGIYEFNFTVPGGADVTAPLVTINFPANTTYTSDNMPLNFNVTLNERGSVIYSLNGGRNNVSMISADEGDSFGTVFNKTNSSIADGSYSFSVYANDSSGNKNYTESVTFSFIKTNITACGTLSEPHRTYYLKSDISTTGSCFVINKNNITLDGEGHKVEFATGAVEGDIGISIINNANNTNLKNIFINSIGTGSDMNETGIRIGNEEGEAYYQHKFENLSINSTSDYSYNIHYSSRVINSIFNDIRINSSGVEGIGFLSGNGGNNNSFSNITIRTNGENAHGVYLSASNNDTLRSLDVLTAGTGSHGIYFVDSMNERVYDSKLNGSAAGSNDSYLEIQYATYINFTNVTLANNKNNFGSNSNGNLYLHWYLDAYANYTNGSIAINSNISSWNKNGAIQFSEVVGSNGRISKKEIIEYKLNSTEKVPYSNYTFNATNVNAAALLSQSWNMTQNRFLNFMFELFNPVPTITINNPENNSNVTSGNPLLNWTVEDNQNNSEVWVWVSNTTGNLYDRLVYHNSSAANGTYINNLTGLPINPVDSGLVLLQHFDGDTGVTITVLPDESSWDINPDSFEAIGVPERSVNGVFAEMVELTAGNSFYINNSDELSKSAEYTIVGWIKIIGNGTTVSTGGGGYAGYPIINKGIGEAENVTANVYFAVGVNGSNSICNDYEDSTTGNSLVCSPTRLNHGYWYWFAVIVNSSSHTLYLNGKEEIKATGVVAPTTGSVHKVGIGTAHNSQGAQSGQFLGAIDELAFFNKSLPETRLFEYYNLSVGRYYWRVNATDGTTMNSSGVYEFNYTTPGGLDTTDPAVILNLPEDGDNLTSGTDVAFNCTATDAGGLANVTLYINSSGGLVNRTLMFRENGQSVNTTDDGGIYADNPNVNNGTLILLSVDGSPQVRSVIKFPNIFGNGADQIPLGATILEANLTLYNVNDPGHNATLYFVNENWTETGVTWNNRSVGNVLWTNAGVFGTTSADRNINATTRTGDANAYSVNNVTAFMQNWSNGGENNGFLLYEGGTSGISIASSEHGTATYRPMLSVIFQTTSGEIFTANQTKTMSGTSDNEAFYLNMSNGTFKWNCLASDTTGNIDFAAANFTFNHSIQGGGDTIAPNITINSPENNSNVTSGYPLLNWTAQDDGNNNEIWVWASNDSLNLYDYLVYHRTGLSNGDYTYTLNALPRRQGNPDMQILYHFDNDSRYGENDTFIYDFSVNGENASCGNHCPTFNESGGKFAGSFDFDDVNDYLTTGNNTIPSQPSEYTVEAWAKVRSAGDNYGMVYSRNINSGNNILMLLGHRVTQASGTQVNLSVGHNNVLVDNTYAINVGQWYHLVTRYNGTRIALFVNGNHVWSATGNALATASTCPMLIGVDADAGCEGTLNQDFLNGTIDEFVFYNRSLSNTEIAQHYNLSFGKHYWRVNASDGTNYNSSGVYDFNYTFISGGDSTAPILTVNLPVAGINLSSSSVDFNVSSNENSTCFYSLNGGGTNKSMSGNQGIYGTEFNATNSSIADSNYITNYYCNDTSNNWNNTESRAFRIDTTKPLVTYHFSTLEDGAQANQSNIFIKIDITEINFRNISYNLFDEDNVSIGYNRTSYHYSFNLGSYARVLNNSNLALTADSSGIAYNPSTNTLFVIHNTASGEKIDETDLSGTLIRSIDINADFTDTEGLCYLNSSGEIHRFAVVEEGRANLTIIFVNNTQTSFSRANGLTYDLGLGDLANSGLEGITYDWARNLFYSVREGAGTLMDVYQINLSASPRATALFNATLMLESGDQGTTITDLSDLYFDNNTDSLFLLSHESQVIANVLLNGTLINNLSVNHMTQPEGITFDSQGDILYVLGESDYLSTWHTRNFSSSNNFTGLANGTYYYNVSVYDYSGNVNDSVTRRILLGSVQALSNPTSEINSTDGSNKTSQDLNCFDSLSGIDGSYINVTVKWYNDSILHTEFDYNYSYTNNAFFNAILSAGNTSKWENWSCGMRLYDGQTYSSWVNSSNLEILNSAPIVTLLNPENGNTTQNRTPTFSWSGSDDDGDTMSYEINITCLYAGGGTCSDMRSANRTQLNSTTSYTVYPYLKYLIDNLFYYNWTVRAWDGEEFGSWVNPNNISIRSLVEINLSISYVNFSLNLTHTTDNTTDEIPYPFVLENIGNCLLNISANFTSIFETDPNPTSNFMFKVRNRTAGCFDPSETLTDWTDAPLVSTQMMTMFNFTSEYQTGCNNVSIDLYVNLPLDEPPGTKSSIATFVARLGEHNG